MQFNVNTVNTYNNT